MLIPLVHGEPIRFGADGEQGVVMGSDGQLPRSSTWPTSARTPSWSTTRRDRPGLAFQLSRLAERPHEPTPIGVFRAVERPDYGTEVEPPAGRRPGPQRARATSPTLLHSGATWTVD